MMSFPDEYSSGRLAENLDPPARWVRALWDEPDLLGELADGLDASCMTFLYEFTARGAVLRAIELTGHDLVPIGAASLAEFWAAQGYRRQPATPGLVEYEDRYGQVPAVLEAGSGDYLHEEITESEFAFEWARARAHLEDRPRSAHFAAG